jgi:NTP pyrophosphatase (non-canonical NTP hydrolase)
MKTYKTNEELRIAAKTLAEGCHACAFNAGWWTNLDGTPRNLDPKTRDGFQAIAWPLLLIISEIIEGAEGVRKNLMDDKLPHRTMFEVELADAMIRILDTAEGLDMDLAGAFVEKLEYNKTRADHKPENRAKAGGKVV